MTASFIKELVRRAVLVALRESGSAGTLTDAHLDAATAEMFDPAQSLTRGLLGAARDVGEPDEAGAGRVEPGVTNGEYQAMDG